MGKFAVEFLLVLIEYKYFLEIVLVDSYGLA